MYLTIGPNLILPEGEILGIFDLDNTSYSRHTRSFLKKAQEEGRVRYQGEELPKSFLLCREQGQTVVYLSQYTPATLQKRMGGVGRTMGKV